MTYSPFTATGNGSTTQYTIAFEYIDTADIKARVNDVATTAFTVSGSTVTFNTAPPNGHSIKIFRDTDNQTIQSNFQSGSALRAVDLNSNFTQLLYVTQESTDVADTATADAANAVSTAASAVSTANTASTNATTAVNTANTASTNATTAVNTANTASTNATTAVNTANTASTNATNAVNTANTANTTANTANTTANTASTNASSAVSTANTASTNASNAVTTANAASATATAAQNAVANAVLYSPVANVSSIPGSPSNNDYIEVQDSTGIQSFSPLSGLPSGFTGASGLTVRLKYTTTGSTWQWQNYFANDPEDRYFTKASGNTNTTNIASNTTAIGTKLPLAGGTLTGALTLSGAPTSNLHAATKAYVDTEVAGLVDSAPSTLDTLNELAAALGDDANFSTTVTNSIATKMPLAGGTFTGNVTFNDSAIAKFGTGSDLQIYHDGSNSYIQDGGTGHLIIRGEDIFIANAANSETMASFTVDGAAQLYYDNSVKLATKSDGVDITGELQCDSLDVDGVATFAARVDVGDSTSNGYSRINPGGDGSFVSNQPSGTNSGFVLIERPSGNVKVDLKADGSATFDSYVAGYRYIAGDGTGDGSSQLWTGRSNNAATSIIKADGRMLLGTTTEGEGYADNLTIADSGNCGLTIRSGTSGVGSIYFSDATSGPGEYDGFIQYNQSTRVLQFGSAATTRMTVDSSGVVTVKNGAVAEIDTLTSGATITPDFAASCNFTVTLGHNATIANPSNLTAGQSGSIFIVQDGTGSRTASFGSYWDFAGGTAPTLTTSANGVDRIDYIVRSSTSIHAVATLNMS